MSQRESAQITQVILLACLTATLHQYIHQFNLIFNLKSIYIALKL